MLPPKPKEQYNIQIGEQFTAARNQRGEDQKTVAAAVGISQSQLSRMEAGKVQHMDLNLVASLAAYLGVAMQDIYPPP